MVIDLASVGTTPKQLDMKFARGDINLEDEARLTSDPTLTGDVFRLGEKIHLAGTVTADIEVDCTRCLEPVARHLEVGFEDIFVDSKHEKLADEAEIPVEALDEALVTENEIDLADVVREQVLLALPEQIFCREDCQGLCPECGENRNLIDCNCGDNQIDPRWAALKDFRS